MKIYLVRHGETPYNREGRFQGQTDVPLSPEGASQGEELAQRLRDELRDSTDALYSSPLQRAVDTARPIGEKLKLEPRLDPGWQEMAMGEWEGKTPRQIPAAQLKQWRQDPTSLQIPGGESAAELESRVVGSLQRIIARHDDSDQIVVVTHGGPLMVVLAHVLRTSLREASAGLKLNNAEMLVLDVDKNSGLARVLFQDQNGQVRPLTL
ncbi:MAG: histidine phosphatase family protein [Armatimonadetes bacterium]|nr:histidine phosphatase family protein [Armatimonadota bacterium]